MQTKTVKISDIIIKDDRIRKDFGDINDLANDIRENGLIHNPVINQHNILLAGERRIRACSFLGWEQIEVKIINTRDAYHDLMIEISENESRKEFSKAERVDYMKRLLRIEMAKAEERQKATLKRGNSVSQNSDERGERSDDAVAKQFQVSRDTLRKEIAIVDNKEALTPADFAEWDEGRLSTNKAYQKIMAEKRMANACVDSLQAQVKKLQKEKAELASHNSADEKLQSQINELIRTNSALQSELRSRDVELAGLKDEVALLKKTYYPESIKTANSAFEFKQKTDAFIETVLSPFCYSNLISDNQNNECGEYIETSLNNLYNATIDLLKRFKTQDAIIY